MGYEKRNRLNISLQFLLKHFHHILFLFIVLFNNVTVYWFQLFSSYHAATQDSCFPLYNVFHHVATQDPGHGTKFVTLPSSYLTLKVYDRSGSMYLCIGSG